MSQVQPCTVVCTYTVKPGHEAEFEALLEKHWPALHGAGLATDDPPQHFRGVPTGEPGGRSDAKGQYVEIFRWKNGDSAGLAHQMPEVMAVWEPMGAICSAMSFPHFEPFTPRA